MLISLKTSCSHRLHDEIILADKLVLLAIVLLLVDVSPTYSTGLPQGNVF